jgi:hypothetical protein
VDLQRSVDQMNSSDANVDQLISGLEQLKGKRYASRQANPHAEHSDLILVDDSQL